jgi:hypothetical protein
MMKYIAAMLLVFPLAVFQAAAEEEGMTGEAAWLPSLITDTPEEGFDLAVKLSRMGVKTTQPDMNVLKVLRQEYSHNPDSLIAASHVIAAHFRTVAEANNYWRK